MGDADRIATGHGTGDVLAMHVTDAGITLTPHARFAPGDGTGTSPLRAPSASASRAVSGGGGGSRPSGALVAPPAFTPTGYSATAGTGLASGQVGHVAVAAVPLPGLAGAGHLQRAIGSEDDDEAASSSDSDHDDGMAQRRVSTGSGGVVGAGTGNSGSSGSGSLGLVRSPSAGSASVSSRPHQEAAARSAMYRPRLPTIDAGSAVPSALMLQAALSMRPQAIPLGEIAAVPSAGAGDAASGFMVPTAAGGGGGAAAGVGVGGGAADPGLASGCDGSVGGAPGSAGGAAAGAAATPTGNASPVPPNGSDLSAPMAPLERVRSFSDHTLFEEVSSKITGTTTGNVFFRPMQSPRLMPLQSPRLFGAPPAQPGGSRAGTGISGSPPTGSPTAASGMGALGASGPFSAAALFPAGAAATTTTTDTGNPHARRTSSFLLVSADGAAVPFLTGPLRKASASGGDEAFLQLPHHAFLAHGHGAAAAAAAAVSGDVTMAGPGATMTTAMPPLQVNTGSSSSSATSGGGVGPAAAATVRQMSMGGISSPPPSSSSAVPRPGGPALQRTATFAPALLAGGPPAVETAAGSAAAASGSSGGACAGHSHPSWDSGRVEARLIVAGDAGPAFAGVSTSAAAAAGAASSSSSSSTAAAPDAALLGLSTGRALSTGNAEAALMAGTAPPVPPLLLGQPAPSAGLLPGIPVVGVASPAGGDGTGSSSGGGGMPPLLPSPTAGIVLTSNFQGVPYALVPTTTYAAASTAASSASAAAAAQSSRAAYLLDDDDITYSFYPGTGASDSLDYNVLNAPIPPLWRERRELRNKNRDPTKAMMGRLAVRRVVSERLIPALRAFGPDLILLSAGFDGGANDVGNSKNDGKATPGMNLSPSDFAWITSQIMGVARICCPGKVVSVLEGGYGQWRFKKAEEAPAAATDGGAAAGDAGGDGGGAATGGGATGGAGAADGDATIAFLRRDNLAENCAAHVRAMVDDGAVAVTAGYDV